MDEGAVWRYNGALFLLLLLSWIACCIGFGGAQFTSNSGTMGTGATMAYYWDHASIGAGGGGTDARYNTPAINAYPWVPAGVCYSTGSALVSMTVFAFLAITMSMFLLIFRTCGWYRMLPRPETTHESATWELLSTPIALICLLIGIIAFGAGCYHATSGNIGGVSATGIVFMCISLFFLLGAFVLQILIRKNSELHSLTGATGAEKSVQRAPRLSKSQPGGPGLTPPGGGSGASQISGPKLVSSTATQPEVAATGAHIIKPTDAANRV